MEHENKEDNFSIRGKDQFSKQNSALKKQRRIKCELCEKSFHSKGYLKLHIKVVHDKIKEYMCDFCNKTFGHIKEMRRHIKLIHTFNKHSKCEP